MGLKKIWQRSWLCLMTSMCKGKKIKTVFLLVPGKPSKLQRVRRWEHTHEVVIGLVADPCEWPTLHMVLWGNVGQTFRVQMGPSMPLTSGQWELPNCLTSCQQLLCVCKWHLLPQPFKTDKSFGVNKYKIIAFPTIYWLSARQMWGSAPPLCVCWFVFVWLHGNLLTVPSFILKCVTCSI